MTEENKVVEAEVVEKKGFVNKIKDKLPQKDVDVSEETEPAKKGALKKWLKRAGMVVVGAAIGGVGYVLGQKSKDDAIDCDYTETEYDSEEE